MNQGQIIFSQVMDFLPKHEFDKCVDRYGGNYWVKKFSCYDQYLCMAFAQLTYRESLRDIETCLRAMGKKLYHAGFRGNIARSTLADANEKRDWRIFSDFAHVLIDIARKLYAQDDFGLKLEQAVYVLDSTTISLCLSLFPWAKFRKAKGVVKLHTLLDLHGNIPSLIIITHGKVSDVSILDQIPLEAGAFYIFDRGYTDFVRFYRIHQAGAFYFTRAKSNLNCQRICSHPVEKSTGLRSDQTVILKDRSTRKDYPERLRRISYFDAETHKRFVFLTNQFHLPALTVAQLYKCRWQVELFFKWIKQHLRIKVFYGTSENAVKTQIWIAISVYVLVAIIKKTLKLEQSIYTILQILSVSLFERVPIYQLLTQHDYHKTKPTGYIQLNLFDY
jgi:hypothetical protein